MLLELSEVLACPVCGPPQVMVVVVDEAHGPLVERGSLACPACDGRFAIEGGVAHLGASGEGPAASVETGPAREDRPGAGDRGAEDAAVLVAALLGLERGGGLLLFGPGLARVARRVADLAGRWSVVSVSEATPEAGATSPNLSPLVLPPGPSFPVQSGRVRGVVLDGTRADPHRADAARVLVPGGRLVVLDPAGSAATGLERAGLEVRASDPRAILAVCPLSGRS